MGKKNLFIIFLLLLCISVTGCQTKYHSFLNKYKSEFNKIAMSIDENDVQESIKRNALEEKIQLLDNLISAARKDVPSTKVSEFMLLKMRHDILKDVIEKGAKYDSLDSIYKMLTDEGIISVKTFY